MGKTWCTDNYCNPRTDLIGKKVKDSLAEFFVGSISRSGLNTYLIMDKDKPFKILNKENKMRVCVESGHYMALAITCYMVPELEGE